MFLYLVAVTAVILFFFWKSYMVKYFYELYICGSNSNTRMDSRSGVISPEWSLTGCGGTNHSSPRTWRIFMLIITKLWRVTDSESSGATMNLASSSEISTSWREFKWLTLKASLSSDSPNQDNISNSISLDWRILMMWRHGESWRRPWLLPSASWDWKRISQPWMIVLTRYWYIFWHCFTNLLNLIVDSWLPSCPGEQGVCWSIGLQ